MVSLANRPTRPDFDKLREEKDSGPETKGDAFESVAMRLPIVVALREQEETVDELHNLISELETRMSPLLGREYDSGDSLDGEAEPHSDVVAVAEAVTRRLCFAAERITKIRSRLEG